MAGRRDALILGGAGAVAAAAGGLAGVLALQSESGAADLLAARFIDLEGRPQRLLDWQRSRGLLCNFWATWCAPCREEVPLLVAAKHKLPLDGPEIVGIGIDTAAKIQEFASNYRINYPLLVGDVTALNVLRRLGNRGGGLPFTVALNRRGALVHSRLGALSQQELGQVLASLVG